MENRVKHIKMGETHTKCQDIIIAKYGSIFTDGYDPDWHTSLVNDVDRLDAFNEMIEREEKKEKDSKITWGDFFSFIFFINFIVVTGFVIYGIVRWYLEGFNLWDEFSYRAICLPLTMLISIYCYIRRNCV